MWVAILCPQQFDHFLTGILVNYLLHFASQDIWTPRSFLHPSPSSSLYLRNSARDLNAAALLSSWGLIEWSLTFVFSAIFSKYISRALSWCTPSPCWRRAHWLRSFLPCFTESRSHSFHYWVTSFHFGHSWTFLGPWCPWCPRCWRGIKLFYCLGYSSRSSVSWPQGWNARKVNCGRVYSAYTLKPVLFGRNL